MIGFIPKDSSGNNSLYQDINLLFCAYDGCDQKKRWGPGTIEYYKLFFAIEHDGYLQINNQIHPVKAGTGFIVPPNTVTVYQPKAEDQWRYFWITFDGLQVEPLLRRAGISINNPIFQINKSSDFQETFSQLFHSYENSATMDLKALSAFYSMLSMIIEENGVKENPAAPVDQKDMYVNEAIAFIRTNYFRPIQIHEIAEHVNIDRKYLYKLFKDKTTHSPKQYLLDIRLNRADELLINTAMSVLEVANSVGYTDQFLFSKTYRRKKGCSPSEYRKQHLTDAS